MKAVILAAGQGTRIRAVHGERPKCLIEVDNETILDHQIEGLYGAGIDEIAIVVGYEKQQIIRHVQKRFGRRVPKIHFIENPAFAISNNIYSLWLAREWVGGDGFVCLNADDGKILWRHEYDCLYTVSYPAGPRTTPVVSEGKVFALGAEGNDKREARALRPRPVGMGHERRRARQARRAIRKRGPYFSR